MGLYNYGNIHYQGLLVSEKGVLIMLGREKEIHGARTEKTLGSIPQFNAHLILSGTGLPSWDMGWLLCAAVTEPSTSSRTVIHSHLGILGHREAE